MRRLALLAFFTRCFVKKWKKNRRVPGFGSRLRVSEVLVELSSTESRRTVKNLEDTKQLSGLLVVELLP